jgi:hypothetical protein
MKGLAKPVLVTGGAGYIGSHITKALAAAGFGPVAFDNLSVGHKHAVQWGRWSKRICRIRAFDSHWDFWGTADVIRPSEKACLTFRNFKSGETLGEESGCRTELGGVVRAMQRRRPQSPKSTLRMAETDEKTRRFPATPIRFRYESYSGAQPKMREYFQKPAL